jgi:hypothetical protein
MSEHSMGRQNQKNEEEQTTTKDCVPSPLTHSEGESRTKKPKKPKTEMLQKATRQTCVQVEEAGGLVRTAGTQQGKFLCVNLAEHKIQ